MSGESSQRTGQEPARDVLAAEAFAVPAPDPDLRRRQVVLPEDPSGIAEPHDILAAEEFALPAAKPAPEPGRPVGPSKRAIAVAAGLGSLLAVLRLRRRR